MHWTIFKTLSIGRHVENLMRREYSVGPSAASLHPGTCALLAVSHSWQVFCIHLYITILYRLCPLLWPYALTVSHGNEDRVGQPGNSLNTDVQMFLLFFQGSICRGISQQKLQVQKTWT